MPSSVLYYKNKYHSLMTVVRNRLVKREGEHGFGAAMIMEKNHALPYRVDKR